MNLSGLKTYLKFLSRQKVYTVVSLAGFAVSLTFVIILSLFARRQVSMDSFHENKDRIYMLLRDNTSSHSNPLGDYVMNLCPEVETYTRVVTRKHSIGLSQTERLDGLIMYADPDFFKIFSFPLEEGDPREVLLTEGTVVLSRNTANRLFGEEDPIGRALFVNSHEMTVSGIMSDFPYNTHLEAPDAIVNYSRITTLWNNKVLDNWGNCSFTFYFLEKDNADFKSKKELLLEKFNEEYWVFTEGYSNDIDFLPLEDVYFSGVSIIDVDHKQGSLNSTRIYIGIALLILIIALLNYINMTVAQAGFRGKEAAIRKLMGSSRGRIIFQTLAETFLMTAFAVVIAVILSLLAEPYFDRMLTTSLNLKEQFTGGVSMAILLGIVVMSVAAGIIPALAIASFRPIDVIKGTINLRVKTGYSKVLIVFQFTVCTALLICTFIMRQQASYMAGRDVGFNRDNILVMENLMGMYDKLGGVRETLSQIPGVDAVGFISGSPLDGGNNDSFTVDDYPVSLQIISGDSASFNIFGYKIIPTLSTHGPNEDIVYLNRAAYNLLIREDGSTKGLSDAAVLGGILEDINVYSLHRATGPLMFYFWYKGQRWRPWEIVVKLSSDDIYETARRVREAYSDINGGEMFDWYFADETIHSWYEAERRMTRVMASFTLLSIVIMVMGVFAMSLYMIRQKEKEIGIRKVNGATVGEIMRMLIEQSLTRVAIAFILACPIAWYGIDKWLQTFAYKVDVGPWPFVLSGVGVTFLCLASVSCQTLRAARANPVECLKSE